MRSLPWMNPEIWEAFVNFFLSDPRRTGVRFLCKGIRESWSAATRGPFLRPWTVGNRSPHRGVRGSGLCASCFLLLMVYECMLWGHPSSSNKSALRLSYSRRSRALRTVCSRSLCCFSFSPLRILNWAFRRGYAPSALREESTTVYGSARYSVKPFLITQANPVVALRFPAHFVLPLGVNVLVVDELNCPTGE